MLWLGHHMHELHFCSHSFGIDMQSVCLGDLLERLCLCLLYIALR
jgi:hypothetical protein